MFLLGEYGCGPSGRVKTENFVHYAKGHHFLRCRDMKVVEDMVFLQISFVLLHHNAIGRYHFGKNDLITTYTIMS